MDRCPNIGDRVRFKGNSVVGAPKLSDNEKAATFIGWRVCSGVWEEWRGMDRYFKCTGCSAESSGDGVGRQHGKPDFRASDMSDPRNYMKALEAVVPNFSIRRTSANARWIVQWGDDKSQHYGQTMALAVMQALAALYDTENPR